MHHERLRRSNAPTLERLQRHSNATSASAAPPNNSNATPALAAVELYCSQVRVFLSRGRGATTPCACRTRISVQGIDAVLFAPDDAKATQTVDPNRKPPTIVTHKKKIKLRRDNCSSVMVNGDCSSVSALTYEKLNGSCTNLLVE
ncbi:hypothetical protein ZEAMMB73_Zm00001d008852 [Zea mays]|uniref:Uncharacterized protein n=1 Tax=Zea mays TaxID=4577 RepID=A0A1D6FGC4_MAIZE|nr:hypothetical protein ZEAMMB73_Zm00001d008852 [Zea mays]